MLIERDYLLKKLIAKQNNGRIKIITGIRRCGKSYLLFKLFKEYLLKSGVLDEQIVSLSLDDVVNLAYRNPFKMYEYIKKNTSNKEKQYYVFIDEIQLATAVPNPYIKQPDAEKITFIDILLSLMKEEHIDIYVTGSNSKMLASDVLTQFRDRGDEIHVLPLSFKEIVGLYKDSQTALADYLIYGGMPYIFSIDSVEEKSLYLKNLFSETYIKDVIERNAVQNDTYVLNVLLDFISSAIGSLTNPYKLEKRYLSEQKISISSNTLTKYIDYFIKAYVVYKADRYDVKGSRYFSTPVKYYFADIGLRNARLNFRQIETTHAMENIIYNELYRRGYNIDVGVVESEKTVDGHRKRMKHEVDFVVNYGEKRYYIQSALHVDTIEKKEQEIASLLKINDSFKKIVIVKEKMQPRHDENGILYMGLEDFLLDENAIDA